jgi:hypothetical protein
MPFKNVTFFGQVTDSSIIEENVVWYIRDGLLDIGAFYNMSGAIVDRHGVAVNELRPSYLPGSSGFQFWTGRSHQWVWESGVSPTYAGAVPPIVVSGVYVTGAFIPTGTTGTNEIRVDYNRGGVYFVNRTFASGTAITCNRSERAAFVYPGDSNEARAITNGHLAALNVYPPGSGEDVQAREFRTYLPAIVVDVELVNTTPYELGSSVQHVDYKVIMNVYSEDKGTYEVLMDACRGLRKKGFTMFDPNDLETNTAYPLDYLGQRRFDNSSRDRMVELYPWKRGQFGETPRTSTFPSLMPVHRGQVSLVIRS